MADITIPELQALLTPYEGIANAIESYASRPMKNLVDTTSTTETTPYALADMLARRDRIGRASAELDEALKEREGFGYNMANALSGIQVQPGYGSWLGDFGRVFGNAYAGATNARADRAIKRYNNELKDLETALKFDKEMGSTQVQNQHQNIGYEEMPWGGVGGKGKGGASGGVADDVYKGEIAASNLGDLYKTIEDNPNTFSTIGGVHQDEASRALRRGVNTAGVKEMQQREFEYLNSIMPNGFASAINAAKEQENMAPYTTAYKNGTGSEKKAQIKNMLGYIYDIYKLDANRQGFDVPITREQYINSRISAGRAYNPDFYIKSDAPMYKDNGVQPKTRTNTDAMKAFMEGTL